MIEIYLPDMPDTTTIKCTNIEGVQALKQLYLDAIAHDMNKENYHREFAEYEIADRFQKRIHERLSTLYVLDRYISEESEGRIKRRK